MGISEEEFDELFYKFADFHVRFAEKEAERGELSKQTYLAIALYTTMKTLMALASEKLGINSAEVNAILTTLVIGRL